MKLEKIEIIKNDENDNNRYIIRFHNEKNKEINLTLDSKELSIFIFKNILDTRSKLEMKSLLSDHILMPRYDENYIGEF